MTNDDVLRVLAPRGVADRLSRRGFLGTVGAGAVLAACGSSSDDGDGGRATTRAARAGLEDTLNIYTFAEYHSPANERAFTERFGPRITIDIFDSQAALVAKLELAEGAGGYDVTVVDGVYLPQLIAKGLLLELDKSKIPNFANIETPYLDRPWDPGNRYSAVKNLGVNGYVYDSAVIKDDLAGWADFFATAARPGVSGKVSVPASPELVYMAFWRDGIDSRTERTEDLDHAERVLLAELAPHLKAFDSYPIMAMLEGSYALSAVANGDARIIVAEDPDRYRWVLGAPKTGVFIDHWVILRGARHPEAAHAWINFMLEPAVSAREIAHHGFNTVVKGTKSLLPADTKALEIIYLTDDEVARLEPGALNSTQDRRVAVYNKVKARAGV